LPDPGDHCQRRSSWLNIQQSSADVPLTPLRRTRDPGSLRAEVIDEYWSVGSVVTLARMAVLPSELIRVSERPAHDIAGLSFLCRIILIGEVTGYIAFDLGPVTRVRSVCGIVKRQKRRHQRRKRQNYRQKSKCQNLSCFFFAYSFVGSLMFECWGRSVPDAPIDNETLYGMERWLSGVWQPVAHPARMGYANDRLNLE